MNRYFESFVARMDALVARTNDAPRIARETERHLAELLSHPQFLDERFREPAPDRYRQHVVHVHPEGKYSVVSLVWSPGQETPIHDHRCWCVVGVLDGRETETRYNLYQDSSDRVLRLGHVVNYNSGQVCSLVPPLEDIHKVANGDPDALTISIHVYGDDIAKVGSSINHIFENPVVTSLPTNARPMSWREVLADDTRVRRDCVTTPSTAALQEEK